MIRRTGILLLVAIVFCFPIGYSNDVTESPHEIHEVLVTTEVLADIAGSVGRGAVSVRSVLRSERDRGKLVVVTEHHITDFSSFDRVVLLNRTVIASGRPEDVLRHLPLVANGNEGER